jgi:hypothetical protein
MTRARISGGRTAVARGVAGISADVQQTLGLSDEQSQGRPPNDYRIARVPQSRRQ